MMLTLDIPMEDASIIIAACCQSEEVLACLGAQFAMQFNLDVAVGRL
jgi:hypothetical protein